ncbi:18348_t:CDS:2 [Dentiscutata erythropus]|uniref:18348_t:CDS:1 n=1 Tax=Dentiscutata erythropus TaxID=1348616 RepID=A0A9N9F4W7_9GLOM|nr:18348_t:CDS:2 [Dentiscutata erythropus]
MNSRWCTIGAHRKNTCHQGRYPEQTSANGGAQKVPTSTTPANFTPANSTANTTANTTLVNNTSTNTTAKKLNGMDQGADGIGDEVVDSEIVQRLININDQSLLSTESYKRVDNDIDQTINQITQLRSYTKVHFTRVTNHVKILSTGEHIRHYIMAGNSRGLGFNLEFDVIESELCIQNLKIKIDSYIRREIGHFVENMEKEANLLTFFKGFIEYARLNSQRELFFNAMKQKFSFLAVDVCANYLLKFSDPNDSRISPELIFTWRLNLTSGHVHPDVSLLARMPDHWKSNDEKRVIDQIPYNFQRLVELKGIQPTVEMIVKSIFSDV